MVSYRELTPINNVHIKLTINIKFITKQQISGQTLHCHKLVSRRPFGQEIHSPVHQGIVISKNVYMHNIGVIIYYSSINL